MREIGISTRGWQAVKSRNPHVLAGWPASVLCCLVLCTGVQADPFHLDSPRNQGLLRLEMDNDLFFADDSQFSNGFSLQYHGIRYASWEESRAPGFVKWVGEHFPTLGDEGKVVRYGQGVGQNIVTPGDIAAEVPAPGDIPYAGTLTYSLDWQSFNRHKATALQVTAGVLGEEAMAQAVQKFVHNDLGAGDDPKGWDTQRDSEPVLNLSYQHIRRLAHLGKFDNGWAGQVELAPGLLLGNLLTGAEVVTSLRFGWNIPEGFASSPAPPGRGIFQGFHLSKPASASPHGVEMVVSARASRMFYSVLYDGSILTDDDREVDREDHVFGGELAINYYHYDRFSIRLIFTATSDLIREDSLPPPVPGRGQTEAATSFGSIVLEFPI